MPILTNLSFADRMQFKILLMSVAALTQIGWGTGRAAAEEPQSTPLELQVKAAILFNFAKFIEWPESSAASEMPMNFCVLGSEDFYDTLTQMVRGKSINGRPPVARLIHGIPEIRNCQLLFIGASDKKRLPELISAAEASGVVTVGDLDEFARHGGMIRLIKEANKVRFRINVDAVNRSGLKISSKLLQLAELIHESDQTNSKQP
jgi:hypothetical protein